MTATHTIRESRNVVRRPHAGQFLIDGLPLILACIAALVYGGMEGMPLGGTARAVALSLLLALLYRFACLRRIRYRIDAEQLVCEHGLLRHKVDYMEPVPHRGLRGIPEPTATALRAEDGTHPLDGPQHAEARPYRDAARRRHRTADTRTGGTEQTGKGNL